APRPQVPVSYEHLQRLKDNPEALNRLGAGLAPIAPESGPAPAAAPLVASPAAAPAVFSREQAPVASWSNLTNVPPGGPFNFGNPLLLTDGTVIVHRTDTIDWYKLTPSNTGSYINGTWTKIAPLQSGYAPKFFAS